MYVPCDCFCLSVYNSNQKIGLYTADRKFQLKKQFYRSITDKTVYEARQRESCYRRHRQLHRIPPSMPNEDDNVFACSKLQLYCRCKHLHCRDDYEKIKQLPRRKNRLRFISTDYKRDSFNQILYLWVSWKLSSVPVFRRQNRICGFRKRPGDSSKFLGTFIPW